MKSSRRSLIAVAESPALDPNLWMIPYADLMSNMMILFLCLYGYQHLKSGPARAPSETQVQAADAAHAARQRKEAQVALQLEEVMRGLTLDEMGVKVTARYIHLSLPAPILFAEGSGRVSDEGRLALAKLAQLFSTLPNPILVAGHTDDRPIIGGRLKTNWELSATRAFSVIEVLVGQGLAPERFRARGHGEFRPIADNATVEGRRRNRRIELSLVRE